MAGEMCIATPSVGGNPSILWLDLINNKKMGFSRPEAKYWYAHYTKELAREMMREGYTKLDSNGQHRAKDVIEILKIRLLQNQISFEGDIAREFGIRDSDENVVIFNTVNEALSRASLANSKYKGMAAWVSERNGGFIVNLDSRDASTLSKVVRTDKDITIRDAIQTRLSRAGYNTSVLNSSNAIVNVNSPSTFFNWLENVHSVSNSSLTIDELEVLLKLSKDPARVDSLKTAFGVTTERQLAEQISLMYAGSISIAPGRRTTVDTELNATKRFTGVDMAELKNAITTINNSIVTEEEKVYANMQILDAELSDAFKETELKSHQIVTLKRLCELGIKKLDIEKRKLEREHGVTPESEHLKNTINSIAQDIEDNNLRQAALTFLGEANSSITKILQEIKDARDFTGTEWDKIILTTKALQKIDRYRRGYLILLTQFSDIGKILGDTTISDADIATINNLALDLRHRLGDEVDGLIKKLTTRTMVSLVKELTGTETLNGRAASEVIELVQKDSNLLDYLYSISRVSNEHISKILGTLIRDAKDRRTQRLHEIRFAIRKANHKLFKAGKNSDFMYEWTQIDVDHKGKPVYEWKLKSDIDWEKYYEAQRKAAESYSKYLSGYDFTVAMEAWVENNTVDRIVDHSIGRTERVPNDSYLKPLTFKSKAEEEYYYTMMEIYGEIQSLLPNWAQDLYSPPQIRRTFFDAIAKDKGKNLHKSIARKVGDMFIRREDETEDPRLGSTMEVEADIDNTPIKNVPVYFVGKIKNQKELLKDFSGAVTRMAATAVDYSEMMAIRDIAEFAGRVISNQTIESADTFTGKVRRHTSRTLNSIIRVKLQELGDASNTRSLVNGFINANIYGESLKKASKLTKGHSFIQAMTSVSALSCNILGAGANLLMGEIQTLIEAGAMEFYDIDDWIWSNEILLYSSLGSLWDLVSNNKNCKLGLIDEIFDSQNEEFREASETRFYRGLPRKLLSKDLRFAMYQFGEYIIHKQVMLAILHNIKVRKVGETSMTNLYDAYEVHREDGNSIAVLPDNLEYRVKVKDPVTGKKRYEWRPVTQEFIEKVRKRIRYANQTCHGSMNEEDKGNFNRTQAGKYTMALRRWMIEHYSRRYRLAHWDSSMGEERTGYNIDTLKVLRGLIAEGMLVNPVKAVIDGLHKKFGMSDSAMINWATEYALRWKDLTDQQKANVRRTLMDYTIWKLLALHSVTLSAEFDGHQDRWEKIYYYMVQRMLLESAASMPWGLLNEFFKILNSPFASYSTVQNLWELFTDVPFDPDKNKLLTYRNEKNPNFRGMKKWQKRTIKLLGPSKQIYAFLGIDDVDDMFMMYPDYQKRKQHLQKQYEEEKAKKDKEQQEALRKLRNQQ